MASSPVFNDHLPRIILISGRKVICDSEMDLVLLKEANIIEEFPERVLYLTVGRLQRINDACQRYSLAKHQRLVREAIDRLRR